jgi:hypothetical protein
MDIKVIGNEDVDRISTGAVDRREWEICTDGNESSNSVK